MDRVDVFQTFEGYECSHTFRLSSVTGWTDNGKYVQVYLAGSAPSNPHFGIQLYKAERERFLAEMRRWFVVG